MSSLAQSKERPSTIGAGSGPLSWLLVRIAGQERWLVGAIFAMAAGIWLRTLELTPLAALGGWAVQGVAIPCCIVALRPTLGWLRPRWRGTVRRLVFAGAVAAVLVPVLGQVAQFAAAGEVPHDGGVVVTRLAAEDVLSGRNPYREGHGDELPPEWQRLKVRGAPPLANPVVDVYPYLPAAFIVAIPGVLAERVLGFGGDPRLWMIAAVVATQLLVLARREPAWARLATVLATGSTLTTLYLAWGTNDAVAACGVVVAALLAARRPRLAATILAVAISLKVLLLVAVIPLVVFVVRRRGTEALRPWWLLPAVLAMTTLPFLVLDPAALLGDTVGFWTGVSEHAMPISGFGLPAVAGDLFSGPLRAITTIVAAAAGLAGAVALARRFDHPGVVPLATGVALLGILITARTFQGNYLLLLTMLVAPVWLVIGDRVNQPGPTRATITEAAGSATTETPGDAREPESVPAPASLGLEVPSHEPQELTAPGDGPG